MNDNWIGFQNNNLKLNFAKKTFKKYLRDNKIVE